MDFVESIERYLDTSSDQFTPPMAEAFLAFEVSDSVKQRVMELGDKANFGTITEDERAEYLRYIELDELMTILKLRSRRLLESRR